MNSIKIKPAFNKNNIAIVLSADSNYVPYLAVTIKSIFDNANPKYNYDVLIFDADITDYQKKLLSFLVKPNCSIRYIDVKELLKGIDQTLFQAKGIWSVATFYRLFIPQVMADYDKVLYLDCDIIVKDSLVELFRLDMKNNKIAAVPDCMVFLPNSSKAKRHADKIGIKDYKKYFNAGVVLFRPNKIDYDKFKERFLSILQGPKLSYLDQDILNIIFEDKTYLLDLEWNYQCKVLNDYPKLKQDKKLFKKNSEAKIIHYTSAYKPWNHPGSTDAYEWWRVARDTDFYEQIIYNNTRTSNILLRNLVQNKRLLCKFMMLKLVKFLTSGKTKRKVNEIYNDVKNQVLEVKKIFK